MADKKLRIWWIPQVPGQPFHRDIKNIREAVLLLDTLAKYDQFQLDNNIKPDYANAGGLQEWDEAEQEWLDWNDDEGNSIDDIMGNELLVEELSK